MNKLNQVKLVVLLLFLSGSFYAVWPGNGSGIFRSCHCQQSGDKE